MAYVSPQTVLKALQEPTLVLPHCPSATSGCWQDCRMHRLTQPPPWSTTAAPGELDTPEAEAFGCICFDFFIKKKEKKFFFNILFTFREHAWACVETAQKKFLTNTYLKRSLNLQIQYGTSEVGWTLLSTRPARPCSTWKAKQQSRTQPSLCWMGKKSNLHTEGSLLPQNYYQLEILTS